MITLAEINSDDNWLDIRREAKRTGLCPYVILAERIRLWQEARDEAANEPPPPKRKRRNRG